MNLIVVKGPLTIYERQRVADVLGAGNVTRGIALWNVGKWFARRWVAVGARRGVLVRNRRRRLLDISRSAENRRELRVWITVARSLSK